MSYTFRGFYIPDHMLESLKRYIEHGCPVGDFLTAVLCNDLMEACGRADDENMANLPAYCAFIYNEAPIGCHGSKERVAEWIRTHWKPEEEETDEQTPPAGS